MMPRHNRSLTGVVLFSSFLFSFFESSLGRGVNVGLCDDKLFNCQCGTTPGYPFTVKVEQCTYFYKWKPNCKPCNDLKEDTTCSLYKQCQECQDGVKQCVSCPKGKYGLWCNGDCQCQNDGACSQVDGSCTCPPGFVGKYCQTRHASQCGPLETIANLKWINGESTNVGTVATALCADGYTLMGTKTRTCTIEGTWTGTPPICEPVCKFPNLGPHIQTKLNPSRTSLLLDADNKEVVKEISFSCDAGYSLKGPHRIQCLPSGAWDQEPPSCKPKIICGDPGMPRNGSRLVSDAVDGVFAPGTQIKYVCEKDFFLDGTEVLICTTTGKFSAAIPKCSPVTGCPLPVVPSNGNVEITKPITATTATPLKKIISRVGLPSNLRFRSRRAEPPPGYASVSSRALYSCQTVYYRLQGSATRVCLPNGQWGGKEPLCEAVCGQASEPKRPSIINGTISEFGKWPWQAAIGFKDDSTDEWEVACGGSLISETLVITAAHCVTQKSSSQTHPLKFFRVYLGKQFRYDDMDDAGVRIIGVDAIVVHPNFHPRSLDSDLALIKLKVAVQFNSRIQPVCLPRPSDWQKDLPEGQVGVVTGWGIIEDGFPSDVLLEAKLPIVKRQKCEDGYRSMNISVTLTTNMFCAGLEEGGIGTCKGDSGGPFVVQKETGTTQSYFLEGLTSWGGSKTCATANQYSGFLKISNFVSWIDQYL